MNARVVQRLLETFFRRWYLFVLPLALFVSAGAAKTLNSQREFRSIGVMDVSKGTLLSKLTQVRGDVFGYESAATTTARTLTSLMGTDQFIQTVAEKAGVTGALERGEITPFLIQRAITAGTSGDTLVQVSATTGNRELSARLAQGTIDSFIEYTVDAELSESRAAEEFFAQQAEQYRQGVERAQEALKDFAAANPGGSATATRPLQEQVELDRLQGDIDLATTQYQAALQKAEEARLATEQSATDVRQRLRVIDAPVVPAAPEPLLRRAVLSTALWDAAGVMVSAFALVLATFADRSLRSPADVEEVLGVRTLAVVPEEPRRRGHRPEPSPSSANGKVPAHPDDVHSLDDGRARPAGRPTGRPVTSSARGSS